MPADDTGQMAGSAGQNDQQQQLQLAERFGKLGEILRRQHFFDHDRGFTPELLLDLVVTVFNDLQKNQQTRIGGRSQQDKNSSIQKFLDFVRPLIEQIQKYQLKATDFETLSIIGKGAYGQVSLVKCKETSNVYAMKVLNKSEMSKRAEKACYKEERDILLNGSQDWFTKLHYAFQDVENLYLVMDYYIGGDFLTLISKYDDTLPEDMCRFYCCEMVLAISALHQLGYIHRDIKPHNILIDSSGHIRLADFGSCVRLDSVKFEVSTPVGTPDYISPEILTVIEGKKSLDPYAFETDWWSLGILVFESLYGETPFYAESLVETYFKIMNHKIHFMFPVNCQVTDEAKDFMSNLITDRASRFKTLDQFKAHPWFTGMDWDTIRDQVPPYTPNFSGPDDTSNFDISDIEPMKTPITINSTKDQINIELAFVGFSATFSIANNHNDQSITYEYHSNTAELVKTANGGSTTTAATPAEDLKVPQHNPPPLSVSPELIEEIQDIKALEKISNLDQRLKAATQEWSEMSTLLQEMKKEKNALSQDLRSKEEELDMQIDKNSQLRAQIRTYEKNKRQQIEDIETIQHELEASKVSRKHDQLLIKEYKEKIESMEERLKIHNESNTMIINEKNFYLDKIDELDQKCHSFEQDNCRLANDKAELVQTLKLVKEEIRELSKAREPQLAEILNLMQQEKDNHELLEKQVAQIEVSSKRLISQYFKKNHKSLDRSNSSSWQERRSARVDKQEIQTLQLELKAEISEKQKFYSELVKAQTDLDMTNSQLSEALLEIERFKNQMKYHSKDNSTLGSIRSASERNGSELDFLRESSFANNKFFTSAAAATERSSSSIHNSEPGSQQQLQQSQNQGPVAVTSALSASEIQQQQQQHTYSDYHNKFGHSFIIRTFITPIKCYICTSLMVGLVRQGYVCEVCGYACHVGCVELGSPCPYDESKQRPVGIDPQKGIGTAYEGYVKIPKPRGGVRKGWVRMYVVVCDFKLFLYDIVNSGDASNVSMNNSAYDPKGVNSMMNNPSISANTIIDMRDEHFSVSDVSESDVIHAAQKDVPCIFRITTSMIGDHKHGLQIFTQLMLVDKENEKIKWIDALHELHRIIRRNKIPPRNTLADYHLLNTLQIQNLRHLHSVHCATMIDDSRLLIGCDDSIICCDLDIATYHRLSNAKKCTQIAYIDSEQLVVALGGKQKTIKLIPIRALDNDNIEWIKIQESKGATAFAITAFNGVAYICVAIRKMLYFFEVTHKKTRYSLYRDIAMPVNIQTLNACKQSSLVAVGTGSNFVVYHVNRMEAPLYLVNQDSPDLTYLIQNSIDPMLCEPLGDNEWLLVFAHYGVYVDSQGKRTRFLELQYPSQPLYTAILRSPDVTYLLVFAQTHIDVFDVQQTKWIQTINLKATKPLQMFGEKVLVCITNALDLPNLVQIVISPDNRIQVSGDNIKAFTLNSQNSKHLTASSMEAATKKNSKIQISAPTDFSHISHLGPGVGPFSSTLIDLNDFNNFDRPISKQEMMSKSQSNLQYRN